MVREAPSAACSPPSQRTGFFLELASGMSFELVSELLSLTFAIVVNIRPEA